MAKSALMPEAAQDLIREKVKNAMVRIKDFKPYKLAGPVQLDVRFKNYRPSEMLSYLSIVERVDAHLHPAQRSVAGVPQPPDDVVPRGAVARLPPPLVLEDLRVRRPAWGRHGDRRGQDGTEHPEPAHQSVMRVSVRSEK